MTSQRRRSRELVLQGLYQRQLSGNAARVVRDDLVASPGYLRADKPYFDEMWQGVADGYDGLLASLAPLLDRKPAELSPVERAILVIGAWELTQRADIPYRVVINEAVELAKSFGGTDGHRFVNGVLDRYAADARAAEIAALHR
ncbi:MAG: transcription antitermination factor NusB [Burkholderiales bacterium]